MEVQEYDTVVPEYWRHHETKEEQKKRIQEVTREEREEGEVSDNDKGGDDETYYVSLDGDHRTVNFIINLQASEWPCNIISIKGKTNRPMTVEDLEEIHEVSL